MGFFQVSRAICQGISIAAGVVLFFAAGLGGCASATNSASSTVKAAHHSDGGFRNPYLQSRQKGFFKYLKMRYFSEEEFADYRPTADRVAWNEADLRRIQNPGTSPQITWIGHASVLVQYRGVSILIDPMFSRRASPVNFAGPERVNPPALKIEDLPAIDLVIISHNHYDHLDTASVRQIGAGPLWLVPLGLKKWFTSNAIPAATVFEFDWWDEKQFEKAVITAAPAQHWSARGLLDRNETLWASWILQIDDFTLWYSGDTGYNEYQFREIGHRFPRIDLALISIGAYEPRWFMKEVHINPEEAVQIHQDIQARRSLAIQWGTFPLSAEPIDDPPKKLSRALLKRKIPPDHFTTMEIGETKIIK